MSLSARIKHLANTLAGSESKLAPAIGVHPRALNRLINDESPKLWTFLPAILSRYPEISRDWLYFGEGEITGTAPAVREAAAPAQAQSMPVTGFAACGTQGWGGKNTFPLAVSAPLFERVKKIANDLAGSETKLAKLLDLPQQKFNGYLNMISQKNLWAYLPAMLEIYPELSRDWLYFGEGEMTGTAPAPAMKDAAAPESVQSMPLFERVKKIANDLAGSETKLAKLLGLPQRKFNGYLNMTSQKNLWAYLPAMLEIYPELSRDWLYFGEGEMTGTAPAPAVKEAAAPEPVQSMPVTGFAACGTQGWGGKMTFPLAVSAPHSRPGMLAVMATGESMIPEGIGHGHICFCDPGITPMPGECVYVETADHKAALKAFVGRGEAAGHGTREGEVCLRGWLDKQGDAPQKDFYLRIPEELVLVLAPVVYVQRRL